MNKKEKSYIQDLFDACKEVTLHHSHCIDCGIVIDPAEDACHLCKHCAMNAVNQL